MKLRAINNDKEWTAAEATGGLNPLWRQIWILLGFLQTCYVRIEDF